MRDLRNIVIISVAATFAAAMPLASYAAEKKSVVSGKTQVVAKLNSREITISDLRSEMSRLGVSPNNVNAERVALDSIINRALLADAARDAKLHRKPEALRRMASAQEQALADLFMATASQPPEPTNAEIEDFIAENPSLFNERRIYSFVVLTLPTASFDQDQLTPLFDDTKDFESLVSALDATSVSYNTTATVQASSAFPKAIRKQLAQYSMRDNIVIKGDADTQIMKIAAISPAPLAAEDAPVIARQALLRQGAQARAERLLASLKKKSSLSYYRETAAPRPVVDEK